jgi:sugar fermentation stimulation protein A
MKFQEPLRQGEFVKRYKRFFADIKLGADIVVAHVPNTGSLKTCLFAGAEALVSESKNPERKLKATLHFLKTPEGWAGVDTSLPNALVHEAWSEKILAHWHAFAFAKREHKLSKETRLDLVLARDEAAFAKGESLHHVEVKNVTYLEGGVAKFPDAVTERGQKHLRELMKLRTQGHGAEIVFVIQRENCVAFAPADEIDPEYGKLLREARDRGVKVTALACAIDPAKGIALRPAPLELRF